MSTLSPHVGQPDEFLPIATRLEALGGQFRLAQVLGGCGRFLAVVLPTVTAVFFLIGLFSPPTWLSTALLALVGFVAVLTYLAALHAPIWRRPTYAQIARWIEENAAAKNLALHNELINAVLLAQEYEASGRALAERTASQRGSPWIPHVLREIDAGTARTDLAATVPWKQQFNAWCWALAFAALSAGTIALFPGVFVHGWRVLIHPGQFVPHVGAVKIVLGSVHPGDNTVLAGESVNFSVAVEAPDGRPVPTEIAIQYASGRRVSFPMTVFGAGNSQYRYSLATVAESLDYIITAGDSQSERYHIDVLRRFILSTTGSPSPLPPTPAAPSHHHHPRQGPHRRQRLAGSPDGLDHRDRRHPRHRRQECLVRSRRANPVPMPPSADGRTFTTTRTLKDNERYAIRINDGSNRTLARFPEKKRPVNGNSLGYFALTCTADQPPTIQSPSRPRSRRQARRRFPSPPRPTMITASPKSASKSPRAPMARSSPRQTLDYRHGRRWHARPRSRQTPAEPARLKIQVGRHAPLSFRRRR